MQGGPLASLAHKQLAVSASTLELVNANPGKKGKGGRQRKKQAKRVSVDLA